MNHFEQLKGDLAFIRAVAAGADRNRSPAAIYFLWAILVLCGFVLVDVRHDWVPLYWLVAGPVGFMVSAYVGWRFSQRRGQVSLDAGARHLLHWGATITAVFLAGLMGMTGVLGGEGLGLTILLILALGYFQAGVHLDRPFLWIGLVLGAGYLCLMFVPAYTWTALGIALAIALTLAGLHVGRLHEAEA